MKLLFKQRFFSWLDSYDIYDEAGHTVYTVQGQFSWGHKLVICDASGREIGCVREEVLTFLPRFALYLEGQPIGAVRKQFTFFRPVFDVDCMGWTVEGDFMAWDYSITDSMGYRIATLSKQVFNWTDTYVLDVAQPQHAIYVLMIALAIDAAKCSQGG